MQRIIIDIPDNKFKFFMELVQNLGFRKVRSLSVKQKAFVEEVQESMKELDQHMDGKIKLSSAKDFLDEL